jgi:hypothetical protein
LQSNREWVVRNNSKQQVLVGQIRKQWTGPDETRQGLGRSPQTKRVMGEIGGERTKAETKQLGVRVGQGSGRQGGGREGGGKRTKTKKEGMLFVGWKETRGPHRKLGYDKSRTQERPKGHPKEFAFVRKQNKKRTTTKETQKTFQKVGYPDAMASNAPSPSSC